MTYLFAIKYQNYNYYPKYLKIKQVNGSRTINQLSIRAS